VNRLIVLLLVALTTAVSARADTSTFFGRPSRSQLHAASPRDEEEIEAWFRAAAHLGPEIVLERISFEVDPLEDKPGLPAIVTVTFHNAYRGYWITWTVDFENKRLLYESTY